METLTQVWARATEVRGRTTVDSAWPEWEAGLTPTPTIVEPQTEEGHNPSEQAEPANDKSEDYEDIIMDTPPQNDPMGGNEAEGGGRGPEASPSGASQATPVSTPRATPWWSCCRGPLRTQSGRWRADLAPVRSNLGQALARSWSDRAPRRTQRRTPCASNSGDATAACRPSSGRSRSGRGIWSVLLR